MEPSQQNDYLWGWSDAQIWSYSRRTVDSHGKFLVPHLAPGLKVLDCGCGPGSMTVGFAKIVAPGKVVGIDLSDKALQVAVDRARKEGVDNVEFQNANILALPFADGEFDVVVSQAVLSHLKEPDAGVREMCRVAKPGGIIAAKETFFSGVVLHPRTESLTRHWELQGRTVTQGQGSDPDIGIKLGELFSRNGLEVVSHELWCSNRSAASQAEYFAREIGEFKQFKLMVDRGEITQAELDSFQDAWRRFGQSPGAFFAFLWGEAVGRLPGRG